MNDKKAKTRQQRPRSSALITIHYLMLAVLAGCMVIISLHPVETLSIESALYKSKNNINNNVHITPSQGKVKYPPMILIGGMPQPKLSWEHHLPSLSRNRNVIIYEAIGQGKHHHHDNLLRNVSLPFQAEQLLKTITSLEHEEQNIVRGGGYGGTQVDIVGFSFGARLAMACACLKPETIRKLHLSGVASDRSEYGHLAVQAWEDCIKSDSTLRAFAWSVLMATYSPTFLKSQPVDRYINAIRNTNSPKGILALLQQAEVSDPTNPWHVINMANRLSAQNDKSLDGKLCIGELDQMAPLDYCFDLNDKLGWTTEPTVIPNCGHAVGIEGGGRIWKRDVLDFLNS